MTTTQAHDNKKPVHHWLKVFNKLKVYTFLLLALVFAGFSYSDLILRKFFQPRTEQLISIGRVTKISWSSDRLTAVDTLWLPLIIDDEIFVGDMIKTRKYSELELHLNNGTDISLDSDTLIQIETHRGKLVLSFFKGDAQFKNAKDIVVKKGLSETPAQNAPPQAESTKSDDGKSGKNLDDGTKAQQPEPQNPEPAKPIEKAAPEIDTSIYPQDHSLLVLSKPTQLQIKVNAQTKKVAGATSAHATESSDVCKDDCELIIESSGKPVHTAKMSSGQLITSFDISANQIYKWKLLQKALIGAGKIIREGDFETVAPTSLQLKKAIEGNRTVEFVN